VLPELLPLLLAAGGWRLAGNPQPATQLQLLVICY
jgi:hypothetical protein